MARPRKKEKRDRQFNIALTGRELELLRACAARAGLHPTDYGRAQLFAEWRSTAEVASIPPHLDPLFLTHLSRIGNNLNQLTRRMHTFDLPAPSGLEPLLRDIRALLAKGAGDDH